MSEEEKKEIPFREEADEDEDDLSGSEKGDGAEDEEDEPKSDPEENQTSDETPVSQGTAAESAGEWFVDFDVWEATLEAHFGPDFEEVLSRELGPDWVMQLNNMINEAKNFYNVVEEIQSAIQGDEEEEEAVNGDNITFEALEPGEVIYDPTVVGPVGRGRGGGGGGGGGKKLPNLTDLRRKEFEAGEEVKETIPPKSFEKDLIEDKDAPIDENLVLMERSEFSKMSYLAHKELERHKDDLKVRDVLKREGRAETVKRATPGVRLLAAVSLVVFVYAVFSVVSYSICRLNSGNLLSSLPPDFHFQPSTPLHKQGTLSRIIRGDQGIEESPLVVYFLRPKIKRLEMNYPGGAIEERFSLAVSDPTLLAIPRAYRGDSVVVRKHYRQFWPTNLGALTGTPLLSLTENGNLVLSAYETTSSSLLPGRTMLRITDSQNRTVGTAYVASERLNIRIDSLDDLPAQQAALLNARLVLLFSLLSI